MTDPAPPPFIDSLYTHVIPRILTVTPTPHSPPPLSAGMVWTATPGGQYFYFRKTRSPLHEKVVVEVKTFYRTSTNEVFFE